MLWTVAWRNVWRNKKRSLIIIAAIAFGIWAGVASMGITKGAYKQIVDTAVSTTLSHIQIHAREFRDYKDVKKTISGHKSLAEDIASIDGVSHITRRIVIQGMASSAETGTGVEIQGVIPESERQVTTINEKLVEGDYFQTKKRNPIVIGKKLAERLEVGLGKKIILTAQTPDGTIGSGAFRVVGIFKTFSPMFDESNIFAKMTDVNRLFSMNGEIHEIAVITENIDEAKTIKPEIAETAGGLDVATWKEISPEMAMTTDMGNQMLYIFMIIILLALVFGITNTMLMGVLERIREIGVLQALGMKGKNIFMMIVLETIFLSMVGGVAGLIIGWASIEYLSRIGIDLSIVSEGLAAFGMGSMIYPYLPVREYPIVTGMIILTAIIASIYPGIKAVKLNPVEAIRTY